MNDFVYDALAGRVVFGDGAVPVDAGAVRAMLEQAWRGERPSALA